MRLRAVLDDARDRTSAAPRSGPSGPAAIGGVRASEDRRGSAGGLQGADPKRAVDQVTPSSSVGAWRRVVQTPACPPREEEGNQGAGMRFSRTRQNGALFLSRDSQIVVLGGPKNWLLMGIVFDLLCAVAFSRTALHFRW